MMLLRQSIPTAKYFAEGLLGAGLLARNKLSDTLDSELH